MRIRIESKENLAQLLCTLGYAPDLRCGGRGICGRCAVNLLSGEWEVDGSEISAPARALSCRSRLLSEFGEVELLSPASEDKISSSWQGAALMKTPATVIGVDIGTTTIAAVKIRNGEIIGRSSCLNLQSKYGDNVLSRINWAADELSGLQGAVHKSIASLLNQLGLTDVSRIAVAGNTVMSSLFHGIDPTPIGMMPFKPTVRIFPASDWQGIELLTVPCIAGYVGGDLTAGLAEANLAPGEMLVDIGTNCEIVFQMREQLFCTAAAAGPAFEGAGLHFGMRASSGAIDHYQSREDFSVLGGIAARGFCGSAYVDFLAVERKRGLLNQFGRYVPKAELLQITDEIFIHEYDIEQLLKAKAAVWAGIKTLEEHCGLQAEKIYLAGGFAQYLDLGNAIAIAMLPAGRQYEIVGNTSLAGAARLAINPEKMSALLELIDLPQEIALNALPEFEDNFIDGLLLP